MTTLSHCPRLFSATLFFDLATDFLISSTLSLAFFDAITPGFSFPDPALPDSVNLPSDSTAALLVDPAFLDSRIDSLSSIAISVDAYLRSNLSVVHGAHTLARCVAFDG